jgi:hypothetical protein
MDIFAQIASNGVGGRLDRLITPQPLPKSEEIVELSRVKGYKSLKSKEKCSTKSELMEERTELKAKMLPFLQDLVPKMQTIRKIINITEFVWSLKVKILQNVL